MENMFQQLWDTVSARKLNPAEGSYTSYLFKAGLDKILKKIGEESAETIIAAKNGGGDELKNEICDLIYHLTVLMAEMDIPYTEIESILSERSRKIGNLKQTKPVDRIT